VRDDPALELRAMRPDCFRHENAAVQEKQGFLPSFRGKLHPTEQPFTVLSEQGTERGGRPTDDDPTQDRFEIIQVNPRN